MMPKMLKIFLSHKTVWEVFLSHDLAEAEVGRGRGSEFPDEITRKLRYMYLSYLTFEMLVILTKLFF